ncbi:3-deoxy-manno-octulosonate cytidylyltransferase [Bacteroidota bacterium]
MRIIGIIPSRFASSRFPGKPLVDIKGKSMIQRVYEQASKSTLLNYLIVATDDTLIFDHVKKFGGNAIMTSSDIQNGTERCFETIKLLKNSTDSKEFDIVINIQGDEPFINPLIIDKLAFVFNNQKVQIATLIKKIGSEEELFNPNVVKVVIDHLKKAVYFSRQAIPFIRNKNEQEWIHHYLFYKHIGIYGYTIQTLEEINSFNKSSLEKAESLEQLRWIENGKTIHTEITEYDSIGIDTPEDLLKINL